MKVDPIDNCLLELIEATPGTVMVFDSDGRLLYINGTGRHLLGIPLRGQLPTLNVADLYAPLAYRALVEQAVPQSLAGGRWQGETTLIDRERMTR